MRTPQIGILPLHGTQTDLDFSYPFSKSETDIHELHLLLSRSRYLELLPRAKLTLFVCLEEENSSQILAHATSFPSLTRICYSSSSKRGETQPRG